MSRRALLVCAVAVALAGVLVRLPFLARGESFFDSDEAVDALMARHVLRGELPIFYWGQGYKGVPNDYVAAAVFAVFGSSVVSAKAVTLALYVLYLAVQFGVLARMFSPRVALFASAVSATGPPALVFWSLSANGEFVLLMLAGTLLVFVLHLATRSPSAVYPVAAAFLVGFSLWLHPLSIFYLAAAGLVLALDSHWWNNRPSPAWRSLALARSIAGWRRPAALALNAIGALYLLLAIQAFALGGVTATAFGLTVAAHHPQKLIRIVFVVWGASILLQASAERRTRRWSRSAACAGAFLAGFAPWLAHWVWVAPTSSPLHSMDLATLARVLPSIVGEIVPVIAGFGMPGSPRLGVPGVLAVVPIVLLAAFAWSSRSSFVSLTRLRSDRTGLAGRFFPALLVAAPAIFLFSGACTDVQSHRYLVPLYAGLAAALAVGLDAIWRSSRAVAVVLLCALLATFVWQQAAWYRTLQPDRCSRQLVEHALGNHARGGYADYWTSYKLTFLSNERLIVAPLKGDRYPAYTRYVEGLDRIASIGPAGDAKRRAGFTVESTYACGGVESAVMRRDVREP